MKEVLADIKDTGFILYDNILEKIFYFFLFLIFARTFQPSEYGEFITINNLGNILITISGFGLYIQIQRLIARDIAKSGFIFSNFIVLYAIVFIIDFLIAAGAFIAFYGFYDKIFFFCTILWTAINSLSSGLSYAYYGLQKYKKRFFINLTAKFLFFAFTAASIIIWKNFTYAIIVLIAGVIFHLILIIRLFPYSINLNKFDRKYIFTVIAASLPLGAAITFNFLYDKIDIIILSKMTDLSLVAMYGIAYGIYKSSSIAFTFIQTKLLSVAAGFKNDKTAVLSALIKYSKLVLLICAGLNIIIFILAPLIVKILFSEIYIEASGVLKILSFAIIPLGLNGLTGNTLNAIGLFKQNLYVTITGLIFNIIMNIIFIPVFSIFAAAYISLLTEIIILLIDIFYIYKFIKN